MKNNPENIHGRKFILPIFILIFISVTMSCSTFSNKKETVEIKQAELYYNEGTRLLMEKKYFEALTHLLRAKELDPNESKIRINLGMAYYFRHQLALAEAELKDAINLNKKNTDAYLNLGSLYLSQNKLTLARKYLEESIKDLTFSNQFRTYYNLALLALKEGSRTEAFNFLDKSIEEQPDYCSAHFKKGELLSEEYRFKEALESFRAAGKGQCVTEPAAHYYQAVTLLNLNRINEAKDKFQEIFDKFPTNNYGILSNKEINKINMAKKQDRFKTTEKTEHARPSTSDSLLDIESEKEISTPHF